MKIFYGNDCSEHFNNLEKAFDTALLLHQGIGSSGLHMDKLFVQLSSEEIVEICDLYHERNNLKAIKREAS